MNFLKNLKLGFRLGAGFGTVLLLMTVMVTLATLYLSQIGNGADKIVNSDFPKVDALNVIKIYTRANSNQVMERFLETDAAKIDKSQQAFAENRKRIDAAVDLLAKGLYTEGGKAMLVKIKESRAAYLASIEQVDQHLKVGNREEASKVLFGETLPALGKVHAAVGRIDDIASRVIAADGEDIIKNIASARTMMMALGALSVLIGLGFAWWVTRSITVPVHRAVTLARTIAAGDLTAEIDATSKDEVGQLLAALKDMNESLASIVARVRENSDSMASASSQIATGNADLSQRTEEQASSLQETAASMEQLTTTVQQNTETARQANQMASGASEAATAGGKVVGQVVSTMAEITASSKKIGDIITVIDGIAFQTNILALNAAVEAARAGEQGRGFAVVAGEVRSLAQRSAEAAKEVKNLIGESVEKVQTGSRLVDEAGKSMVDIVAQVKRVNELIAEITAAGVEQSSGIQQVSQAVVQLDQVTQQNAALVEESAAAAESLKQQAAGLAKAVSVFTFAGGQESAVRGQAKKSAAAPASASSDGVERRGPNGVTNAKGPKFGARTAGAAALAAAAVSAATGATLRKAGAGGDWQEF